jgi:hypothetical protein
VLLLTGTGRGRGTVAMRSWLLAGFIGAGDTTTVLGGVTNAGAGRIIAAAGACATVGTALLTV